MKRNGSALLVVLGMMAFMIVSAVAFSAYMRSARLPSSYLRRSSASRHLVKAAMARAIDAVDRAIANNPHPGIGSEYIYGDAGHNIWPGRVLLATNDVDFANTTIPVLTLEGLAYIPPPLVNEVRHYSRLTETTRWQQFGFDIGRYAFCAVDVSDYFDVNRIAANTARSSASTRRISLSYLFESGLEHKEPGSGAGDWDDFMKNFRDVDEKTRAFKYDSLVPLVSMADFNLALGQSEKGGLYSPFCRFISSESGNGFYNANGDDEFDRIGRMTFVTDSLFPASDRPDAGAESDYDNLYDLSNPAYQPFTPSLLGDSSTSKSTTTIFDIITCSQPTRVRLTDSIPGTAFVALFDYLDQNSVPVSLACPTVERTPMICGLKPNVNAQFALKLKDEHPKVTNAEGTALESTGAENTRIAYMTYEYCIDSKFVTDGLAALGLETLLVYPFPHGDAVKETTFNVDGRAAFFFSSDKDPMKLRSGSSAESEVLHVKDKDSFSSDKGMSLASGTIMVPFESKAQDFNPARVVEEKDAVYTAPLRAKRLTGGSKDEIFATIRYKWTQTRDEDTGIYKPETPPEDAVIDQAHCGMPPLKSSGEIDSDFMDDAKFLKKITEGTETITLNMSVIARVTDSEDNTVDLVPAHMKDDKTFNEIDNYSRMSAEANKICGRDYPVMLFPTTVKIQLSAEGLSSAKSAQQVELSSAKAVRIDDPRYNYAPESWYDAEGDISAQTWLDKCGRKGRDGDIFMATSDQGYLQSIYELAFIPRLSDLIDGGGITGKMLKNPQETTRDSFMKQADAVNNDLMWNTYRAIPRNGIEADDFAGLGFTSAGTGMKITPYTDSTNIMMAAFANTPLGWRLASTNNIDTAKPTLEMSAADFNQEYAWNEYNSAAKFKWKDLEAIAGKLMDGICPVENRNVSSGGAYSDWKSAWDNIGWTYDPDKPEQFCGVILDEDTELWGVDREFLYGFWRDCFAAKQQLFLLFIRAEPLMMGGEGINQAPPQLGARAVALVWRDPTASQATDSTSGKKGYPHRTRVLFYRQMD